MEINKKQYGLLIPKKNTVATVSKVTKPSVFDQSDSEEESNVDWVKRTLQKGAYGSGQSKADIDRALRDDPTVFQYDEVYDDIEKKKNAVEIAKKSDRKPKYIAKLLAAAERRKQEDERRKERQIQKEREAEGEQFADKESFVTSAYKKKLEELRKLDEAEKRNDYLEEIGDVTKQPDLGGFYRHLYESISPKKENNEDEKSADEITISSAKQNHKPVRQYRKRVSTSESSSEDEATLSKEKEKSDSENSPNSKKRELVEAVEIDAKKLRVENVIDDDPKLLKNMDADTDSSDEESDDSSPKTETAKENVEIGDEYDKDDKDRSSDQKVEETSKRSIWEKRTVGDIFEEALRRYFDRKSNKLSIEVI